MPTGMAVLVNGAMSGQELLGLAGRLEPLHAPFALAGRLMRILRTIVEVAVLSVLDVRDDPALGRGVAFQLIGHHDPRHIAQALQQLLEEALGRHGVAPALDQDIENHAVLIDCTPEIMLDAIDPDEYLIQMPAIARLRP